MHVAIATSLSPYSFEMSELDRRHFLSGSGALVAGALAAKHHPRPRPLQHDNWQSVRDQFALDPDIAHFAAWESIAGETPPFEQVHFDAWLDDTEPARVRGGLANTPGGYVAFEHRAALAEAFQFHEFVGKAAIAERTHSQATQLKEGLADIDGLRTVTPMSTDLSSGMVCVAIPEPHLFEVMEQLSDERFSTSITPYVEHFMRIGPRIVTSPEQVDGLLSALRRLVKP